VRAGLSGGAENYKRSWITRADPSHEAGPASTGSVQEVRVASRKEAMTRNGNPNQIDSQGAAGNQDGVGYRPPPVETARDPKYTGVKPLVVWYGAWCALFLVSSVAGLSSA